jgi:hypothetical protein
MAFPGFFTYDEVGMPATERRLPGLDGPPVEEEGYGGGVKSVLATR